MDFVSEEFKELNEYFKKLLESLPLSIMKEQSPFFMQLKELKETLMKAYLKFQLFFSKIKSMKHILEMLKSTIKFIHETLGNNVEGHQKNFCDSGLFKKNISSIEENLETIKEIFNYEREIPKFMKVYYEYFEYVKIFIPQCAIFENNNVNEEKSEPIDKQKLMEIGFQKTNDFFVFNNLFKTFLENLMKFQCLIEKYSLRVTNCFNLFDHFSENFEDEIKYLNNLEMNEIFEKHIAKFQSENEVKNKNDDNDILCKVMLQKIPNCEDSTIILKICQSRSGLIKIFSNSGEYRKKKKEKFIKKFLEDFYVKIDNLILKKNQISENTLSSNICKEINEYKELFDSYKEDIEKKEYEENNRMQKIKEVKLHLIMKKRINYKMNPAPKKSEVLVLNQFIVNIISRKKQLKMI